ncbi:GNAT family N-acetyltransferase [Metabacillus sp. GX 13764]|uniref:GNAT family N-acetyltransferase n=1 Tax=Metabacillus kandeliae TaxID=2900151 RepID=UPI001E2A3114|nr:GNAT family N-acetyltransferase [Metabacillus kandeliae]MCD7034120.1 GNAT family N-acetyltransferase [Metabacillus kandeliae]
MNVRKPTHKEHNQILALSPKAILEGTLGEAVPSYEKTEQLIERLLDKGSYYVIAEKEGTLMGWVLLGESRDSMTDQLIGFIYELYVLEDFRGHGISKSLMETAISRLKQSGFKEVRLSAYAGNHVIKLYEKMGFGVRTVSMSLLL